MGRELTIIIAAVLAFVLAPSPAALPQDLDCVADLRTGWDPLAETLVIPGDPDPRYSVDDGINTTAALTGDAAQGFPIPPWVANDERSLWISVSSDSQAPSGLYTYRLSFEIVDDGAVDPAELAILGEWSVDDTAVDVLVNGNSTGVSISGFGAFSPFPVNAGKGSFVLGTNTVEFVVENGASTPVNPSGLRVDACVGASAAKERELDVSTGFDQDALAVLPGGSPDDDYIITGPDGSGIGPAPATVAAGGCPIPPWALSQPNSTWIGPPDASCVGPAGEYTYSIEVTLPAEIKAELAILRGIAAADDSIVDIRINGSSTGFGLSGFEELQGFPVVLGRGLFTPGANQVEFVVANGGENPTGLHVNAEIVEGPPPVGLEPSLFSLDTGFDNASGATIPNDASDDNYTITGPPGSAIGPEPATVINDTVGPFPAWAASTELSKWIGPAAAGAEAPPGDYTYAISVELPGVFDAANARILGRFSSDNALVDVRVNGASTGITGGGGFGGLESFPPDAAFGFFQTGLNLVEFVVNNAPPGSNPTGLRVEAVVGLALPDPNDFSTGIDPRGTGLLAAGSPDTRYVVTGPPGSNIGPRAAVVVPADGFPIPPWAANSATSQWVGLDGDDSVGPPGDYAYDLVFALTPEANPHRMVLAGQWGAADTGLDVLLNGNSLGASTTDPGTLASFPEDAGQGFFVDGTNSLTFLVRQAENGATGLRVEATIVPVARANPLDISTGFDQETGVAQDGLSTDDDYSILTPDGQTLQAVVTTEGDAPIPPWVASTSTSRWISLGEAGANGLPGEYIYTTSVILSAAQADQAFLQGTWSADDSGPDVRVNGKPLGLATVGGFTAMTPFPPDAGRGLFVEGINTIEFVVQNGGEAGNPTGLRVDAIVATGGEPTGPKYIRGDTNADGGKNIADPVYLLNNLFGGGPPCPCREACDVNDDGGINIADPVYELNNLFGGGPPIPPPGSCAEKPTTEDVFECESFPPCG